MDTKIKVKQEVPSELASQNESESFPKDLGMIEWYDCEIGIKTEIKQEALALNCFTQAKRHFVKNIQADTCTYSDDMKNDTKSKTEEESFTSDVNSENERKILPRVLIKEMKESSNVSKVEIKEEPWWLERTSETSSYCEEIKNARNEMELSRLNAIQGESGLNSNLLARNDTSLSSKNDSCEVWATRKHDSDIRETFSIEESHYSKHPGQYWEEKIHSLASIQQDHSYGYNINKKNAMCKSTLFRHNLTNKAYECNICHKTFSQLTSLKQHKSVHETVNGHMCQVCEKIFTRKSSLKQHVLIHQGIKPHKCEICEKTFCNLSNLRQHKLIHEGVKRHRCEICDRTFTYLSNLKQHNLIHDSEKAHKCEICEKTFTQMSSLKHHILIHKGVRPHKCEICEKSFTQLTNLKQHILIHKGIKSHKCEFCEKTFTQMSGLKKHIPIHKQVKPHKCEVCEKTFSQMKRFKKHILIHEGVK